MTTITEDYVSFETAKLLKEKGFNPLECGMYYSITTGKRTTELLTSLIACPTLQMATKWLREVHNIVIVVTPSMFWGKYNVSIYKKGNDYPIGFDGDSLCSSYEEASEVAIKHCLKILI